MTKAQVLSYVYPQLIDKRSSKCNQQIKIFRFLGKPFVSVGNLTQSGGLVTKIWHAVVTYTSKHQFNKHHPHHILILGLGAGSCIKPITIRWPKSHITALEIDPVMIDVGKKYFALDSFHKLKIINQDAFVWLKNNERLFDLILIDVYQGGSIPPEANSQQFLQNIKNSLTQSGIAVFNRLSTKDSQSANRAFLTLLKQQFSHLTRIKTPVNQVYAVS
jgi:spermidine synthase